MTTELATLPATRPTGVLDVVRHIDDVFHLGTILVKSRMIPNSVATPEAACAIILKGHELGIGPMQAFDSISVIQGKPTISPQLMLALVERAGILEDMAVEETADSCTITLKRRGRSRQVVSFDRAEAVAMGLAGKDNWRKQFGVMMYWRCVAKACRRVFPDVIAGCYTPDEMGLEVGDEGEIIDGEVIERPDLPDPEPVHAKQPSAPGMYGKEHKAKTVEFLGWLKAQIDKINLRWADEWDDRLATAMAAGLAVPGEVPAVINIYQAKGHLAKWARAAGLIEQPVESDSLKPTQVDGYLALVFNAEGGKAAIKTEMGRYLAVQRGIKEAAIYKDHPDLAPEGYAEEQAEAARGDAYEGEYADSTDPAEAGKDS